ncbi:MAG TPA: TonB-dependent receptor [Rhodanobacteraceae bacterium]|nr:TonB-dependent receptor [Rhodanobacteraceae bacterium]
MRLDRSELSKAVQTALSLGAVAAVGVAGTAFAQNTTTTTQNNQQQPQTLQTIVVTGSHIRRVDLETSNPVTVVTSQQIQASGKLTLGDIVQELPGIAGNATNPNVNNGGGTGASTISLRGLGSSRTLILVDGKRVLNNDINAIPAELVERVEVLKDGASSVYGSDAIGGVVNFILKHNYQGADFGFNYGISDRDDAERKGYHFTFGQTTDKGSIIAGLDYNKFEGVVAGNRDYSKCAVSLTGGAVVGTPCVSGDGSGGSLASLSGYLYPLNGKFPGSTPYFAACGGGALTTDPTAAGGGGIPAGFRCFNGSTDHYNYQAVNLVNTPQERTNAYFLADYNLTDNVSAYLDVFVNRTHSSSQVAPTPMELYGSLTMEPGQPYNPFPFALGGGGPTSNPNGYLVCGTDGALPAPNCLGGDFLLRLGGVGDRISSYTTETDQILTGLKGNVGNTGWQWNVDLNYGHVTTRWNNIGYMNFGALQASGDVNADCATNGVDGCLNPFTVNTDPAMTAIMSKYLASPFFNSLNVQRTVSAGVNGPLFSLPAGEMQLAVGADYSKLYSNFTVDPLADNTKGCGMPSSSCSTPLTGGYNYKEVYAELFVPILKDLPFVNALNVTLGDRYSKYSLAGSTNNYKIGVEWRPIDDLMLRGTVASVFRAPTIPDLFKGAAISFDPYTNPCQPGDENPGSGHDVFCSHGGGVAVNGTQIQAVWSGAASAGTSLSPEYGKSFDFGAVYSPHFVPGLTLQADLWRVYLRNNIIQPFGSTEAGICYATNDPNNPACSSIKATGGGTGTIISIGAPVTNLGNLWTRGVDVEGDYRVPQVGWLPGQFSVRAQATYISQFDNEVTPGIAGDVVRNIAGKYDKQYGMFPRVRGLVALNWQDGPWQAYYQLRYIGKYSVGSGKPDQASSCDEAITGVVCSFGAWTQSNVSLGYTIQPINTTLQLGVDNLFDKQPPIMYQNNTLNGNTDVNTFDTIGRFYWMNVDVKF